MKIDPTKYLVNEDEVDVFEKFGSRRTFDDGTTKSNRKAKKQQSHRKEKAKWQSSSQI